MPHPRTNIPAAGKGQKLRHRRLHKTRPTVSRNTSTLSDEEVAELIKTVSTRYGWDNDQAIRPFQLAGIRAQLEGVDMLLQAPTGAGKTVIAAGPHASPRSKGMITLLSVPLIQLAEDMVTTFREEFKLNAVAIHSGNGALSPLVIKDILALKYQVVIASPEMLQSRTFVNKLLRNPSFSQRILSFVVDEAHCISLWGAEFRKKYASLGIVRAFLPRGTPVIAMTATLTGRVRRDINSKLHFAKHGSQFRNEGNNRPNVSIVVRACEHPLASFADLDFIIPTTIRCHADVPKTYLYVDNINTGSQIIDHLSSLLRSRLQSDPSHSHPNHPPSSGGGRTGQCSLLGPGIIRPFNATLSKEYRNIAMAKFREGDIRILVCTDAAGMGINVSDVDVVVQWKLPATLSNFIQRAGRAARGRGRKGLAVLLVEPSAYKVDLITTPEASTTKRRQRKKKLKPGEKTNTSGTSVEGGAARKSRRTRAQEAALKAYAIAHGVERGSSKLDDALPTGVQPHSDPDRDDEGLLVFVQSVQCRREVWASVFENDPKALVGCCDICVPTLFNRTRPGKWTAPKKAGSLKKGLPDIATVRQLMAWRTKIYKMHHTHSLLCPSAILDDNLLLDLSSYGPIGADKLRQVLQPSWLWWEVYGGELLVFLESLPRVFTPRPKKSTAQPATGGHAEPGPPPTGAHAPGWNVTVHELHTNAIHPVMATGIHRFVFQNADVYTITEEPM
ncbi:P-loop containing nucleoside triphosphate hydrolase protein [Irpex lacteus]|nr:P-loop containing nucleoside triphosphate hydrolase protein [Irpex lacteus]